MKFKELMKKVFSTKKGKAIFSVVIAAAILGVSVGSYKGYQANEKAKQEALIEKENEERIANYKSLAKECDDEIDAIGTVTAESEPMIKQAEGYYDDLPKGAKDYVTKYDILVSARTALDALLTSKDKADKVIAEIDAIGDVELTKADQIATARTDYDALTDDEKAMVTNYDTLTNTESALTALNDAAASKDTEVPNQGELNKKSKKSAAKKTASDTATASTSANTANNTTSTPTQTTTGTTSATVPSTTDTTVQSTTTTDTASTSTPSTDTASTQPSTDTASTTTPSTTTTPADTASTTTPSTETTTTSEPTVVSIEDNDLPGDTTTKLVIYSDGSRMIRFQDGIELPIDF